MHAHGLQTGVQSAEWSGESSLMDELVTRGTGDSLALAFLVREHGSPLAGE